MLRCLAGITAATLLLASCGSVHSPVTLRAQEECPSCGLLGPDIDPALAFWAWDGSGLQQWTFSDEQQTLTGTEVYVEPAPVQVRPYRRAEVGVGCMQRRRTYDEFREPHVTVSLKVVPPPAVETLSSLTAGNAVCARLGSSWRMVVSDPLVDSWDGTGFWASGQRPSAGSAEW